MGCHWGVVKLSMLRWLEIFKFEFEDHVFLLDDATRIRTQVRGEFGSINPAIKTQSRSAIALATTAERG
jgi:hypothetical protein